MMIDPQSRVYEVMIVGEHSRENDLVVTISQGRMSTSVHPQDEAILTPPLRDA